MKKTFAILLCLTICICICSCDNSSNPSTTTYEKSIWDGSISDSFQKGDGSESSPYEITNASQFALLAKLVNEGNL